MEKENCLNEVVHPLAKKFEIIQWIILSILIFVVPMIIPQLLSGLFGETSWIAAHSQYVVFKSASIFTVYMIPAIWAGNFVFVYLYRKLFVSKKVNYILSSIASIIVKVAIIYTFFKVLTLAVNIPSPMLKALNMSMGMNQAITASIAAVIGYGINKVYRIKAKE